MLILQADHTIVSLAVLGCVSYCQCQVQAVQAKLLPTLILVAAGIPSRRVSECGRPDKPGAPPLGQLGSPKAREATVAPVPGVPVCHPYPPFGPCGPCGPFGLPVIAVPAAGPFVPVASGPRETLGHAG